MTIICLGDSLTHGCGIAAGECWVSLLDGERGDRWVNAGVNGDTSGGMLCRLREDVLSRRPDMALLMGGTNDLCLTGSDGAARANMTAMLHQCIAAGVRPVIGVPPPLRSDAVPPWAEVVDIAAGSRLLEVYARWLRALARCFGLRCADQYAAVGRFAAERGPGAAFLPDGVHPTAAAHRVMADTAREAVYGRKTERI